LQQRRARRTFARPCGPYRSHGVGPAADRGFGAGAPAGTWGAVMGDLVQLVVSGTATGAIYALAALGFTLLWQASGTINFAQGEFVMLPAFAILFFIGMGAPLWLAFLLACLASMLVLGAGFKRIIADPLLRHGVIPLVIASLGLAVFFKQAVKATAGAQAFPFPSPFPAGQFAIAGVNISYADVGTLLLAGLIVLGLQAFLNRTVTGRAMQACAQNTDAARVLGIDVPRMVLFVFLINAVLAVVAALLITPTYLAKFDMGETIGLKAFFAAIIGGFNQTRGALVGGVLIGVLEYVVGFYVSPAYKEGVALVLFLAVILFRPEGLLGKAEERKV
jgi:branched-chain amino acid transport system permease protein